MKIQTISRELKGHFVLSYYFLERNRIRRFWSAKSKKERGNARESKELADFIS